MRRPKGLALVASTALTLASACTVGPDYNGPPDVAPVAMHAPSFNRSAAAPVTAAVPVANWWEPLADPVLTQLIETAMARSPTLRTSEARLRGSRATVVEKRAGLLPQGGISGLAARAEIPLGTGTSSASTIPGLQVTIPPQLQKSLQGAIPSRVDFNLFSAGFDASWEIDLFGGTRRGIESAHAQAESDEARLADAQVQLAAEVAQAYINLRGSQRRAALTQQTIDLETRMLGLVQQQLGQGVASQADAERANTQLSQTRAGLPTLLAQIDESMDRLALLTAAEPGQLDPLLSRAAALPMPPAFVPIGDPAAMLRRRPDIRQAERQIVASNAQIGQAIAQYFPTVNLLGNVGFSSSKVNKLFTSDSFSILGGPSLTWNILNIPRTAARVDEAKAGMDEAVAQYESTVLSALQDAETTLSRYGHQRENVAALIETKASADRAAGLTRQRQQAGTATLIDLLDTERQRAQAEQNLVQSEVMLTNDYVSLQKSLGLGWGAPAASSAAARAGPERPK